LYNNYYNQISSTAINSRIGAELQVENNVFENTQNPIVSFYSDVIGYWNTLGNLFGEGVTWTTPADGDVVAGPDATPTSSYEVPYDYVLDDADVVKQRVINYSGVGKINQNADDIPPLN
jgi:pectate lyase